MDLFPAIDLRRGSVVRLSQGEATRETVYDRDPAAAALRFADAGAGWLHVVDLDRAFGEGDNLRAIERIIAAVGGRLRVQLGGGLRSLQRIEEGLALGAARVVVGTAAVKDPGLLPEAVRRVGAGRLAAGVDARDGVVAVRGWRESGGERVEALAPRILESGIRTIVYTDISRDGMLAGPDLRGALAIRALGADVVVSGGVSSLGDLRAVRDAGLAGAIVGRALYEGRFDAADALAVAAARS